MVKHVGIDDFTSFQALPVMCESSSVIPLPVVSTSKKLASSSNLKETVNSYIIGFLLSEVE